MEQEHKLVLTKLAERALQEKVIAKNRDGIVAKVNTRSLQVAGWSLEADLSVDYRGLGWRQHSEWKNDANYRYEMYLKIVYSRRDDKQPDMNTLHAMCRSVFTGSAQPVAGRWTLTSVDGKDYTPPDENAVPFSDDFIGYSEVNIPANWDEYFNHLYGLDAHVGRVKRSIEAGLFTKWESRLHQVLVGPPGCGKTDICGSIRKALGEEAVLEFDATETTAAGAIKELSEREILPRVLMIEEIEKVEEKQTSHLLSIMDMRAEIRKTTARQSIQRDTKLLCIATVNNYDLFLRMNAGALASRFGEPIWFKRPSRGTLQRILEREVIKYGGDLAWVAPALDYCDERNITAPRSAIGICIMGREMLVTGEFQQMMRDTSEDMPDEIEYWENLEYEGEVDESMPEMQPLS